MIIDMYINRNIFLVDECLDYFLLLHKIIVPKSTFCKETCIAFEKSKKCYTGRSKIERRTL